MVNIIDGVAISKQIRSDISEQYKRYNAKLAIVRVGEDASSSSYIRNNIRLCEQAGIQTVLISLDANTTTSQLHDEICKLNNDVTVSGIIVQMPLPRHIDKSILNSIDTIKDVDCLSNTSCGLLFQGNPVNTPNTPQGAMALIKSTGIDLNGANAVVVGRSNIVGKPMAFMLLNEGATVTVCHSKTRNLASFTRTADILVVAVGKPDLITADMVKEGAIVIDIGINYVDNKLCGDVSFDDVCNVAGYITPVPGGCGPMTVTCLMLNTLNAAHKLNQVK